MEVAPERQAGRERAQPTSTCARQTGALVPLSSFATVERTVGPDRDQPRRPAAGGDRFVQPGAGRGARRRDGTASTSYREPDRHAGVDHHQLRRRRGGVQELAGQPGDPDRLGAAGDLRAARRALRELHPPADDPRRAAVGGGRRAPDVAPVRPRPDADRDDRHPAADRHRQEERDHDDRLRARRAAHARHAGAGRRSARPASCASGRS